MAVREIWEDIIEVLNKIESDQRKTEHIPFIPKDGYGEPYEDRIIRIFSDIRNLDWEEFDVKYEGESPDSHDNYSEKVERELISEDWKNFNFRKCAWYQSYHFWPRGNWGIHIMEPCWDWIAQKLWFRKHWALMSNLNYTDAIKSAFLFIFYHEIFHYIVDISASIIEIIKRDTTIYRNYTQNVYWKDYFSQGALEEALANRYLFGKNESCFINSDYLYHALKAMPKGYCDFDQFLSRRFWIGRRKLISQILFLSSNPLEVPIEQIMEFVDPRPYIKGYRVPIWLHIPPSRKQRIFPLF